MPPVVFKSKNKIVLMVLLYRRLVSIGLLVPGLICMVSSLPINKYRNYRIFIIGDFNLDQILDESVRRFDVFVS